jgi:hypothetical protein
MMDWSSAEGSGGGGGGVVGELDWGWRGEEWEIGVLNHEQSHSKLWRCF